MTLREVFLRYHFCITSLSLTALSLIRDSVPGHCAMQSGVLTALPRGQAEYEHTMVGLQTESANYPLPAAESGSVGPGSLYRFPPLFFVLERVNNYLLMNHLYQLF